MRDLKDLSDEKGMIKMQNVTNSMKMTIAGFSKNESLARMCVSAFASQLDPTIEEISDIKSAVSEAVTNCVIHAYDGCIGKIRMELAADGNELTVSIQDW